MTSMSSKILVESGTGGVRPFAWRTVASSGESVDRRRASNDVPSRESTADLDQALADCAREARQTGFREGEQAARAAAQAEVQGAIQRLVQSIAEIEDYRNRLHREAEVDAVRLSIAIARRVLRREVTVDPSAIEGLVRAALEKLQAQDSCRVRLHPDHVPALRGAVERVGMSARVEIIPDADQEAGAVVFEMARGNLDASIETQLKEIERGLADRFQRP